MFFLLLNSILAQFTTLLGSLPVPNYLYICMIYFIFIYDFLEISRFGFFHPRKQLKPSHNRL